MRDLASIFVTPTHRGDAVFRSGRSDACVTEHADEFGIGGDVLVNHLDDGDHAPETCGARGVSESTVTITAGPRPRHDRVAAIVHIAGASSGRILVLKGRTGLTMNKLMKKQDSPSSGPTPSMRGTCAR